MSKFEEHITINKYELDKEWLRQASLYHYYLLEHVNAVRDRELLRAEQEELVANMASEIRERLTGSKAPTETAIKQEMAMETDYLEMARRVQEADHACGVLQAAVKAMDVKRVALENLVKLQKMDWFSRPVDEKDEHGEALNTAMEEEGKPRRKLGKVGADE